MSLENVASAACPLSLNDIMAMVGMVACADITSFVLGIPW